MTGPSLADVVISEAARRFVAARHRLEEATGHNELELLIAYDLAFDALMKVVDLDARLVCEVDVVDREGRL